MYGLPGWADRFAHGGEEFINIPPTERRSRSFVATEAIREYVKVNEWQIEETRKALAEADRGEFASPSEVRRVVKKWCQGTVFLRQG